MILIIIYNEKLVHQEAWYFKNSYKYCSIISSFKKRKYFFFIVCVKPLTRYIASCAHTQTTSNTQTQNTFFICFIQKKRCIVDFSHNILTHLCLIIFISFWGQDKIVHVQSRNQERLSKECLKCNNKNCVFADCFENNYFVCIEVFIKVLIFVLKYDVLFRVFYNYQMLEYNSGVIGTDNKYIFSYDYIFMNFISSRIKLHVFDE